MELSHFCSEYVYGGIGYHSLWGKFGHCLDSSPGWKLWGYCLRLRHMQGVIFMCYEQMPLWLWCLSYSRVGFYWLRLYDEGFVDGCGQCWMGILLLLSLLLLLLCRKSRVRRTSPSGVYLAGKLQWRFACGFNFGHSLWLPFVAALAVLRGGGCW